ncbi:MAG: 50S ribosomal protein L10 [Chloroflexi bacterium]|nr:50S ribosomal protein L10 [Chloroflexota bacterium]
MPSQKNINEVERLRQMLAGSSFIVATGYSGLSALAMADLRKKLRELGLEYRVVKNTLVRIAAEAVGRPGLSQVVEGPTGLVLSTGDPALVAKALEEYLRTSRVPLVVRGGVLDGRALTPQEVSALAKLPPRPVLVAQLMGQLKGYAVRLVSVLNVPAGGLANVLNGPSRGLATVLARHQEKASGA